MRGNPKSAWGQPQKVDVAQARKPKPQYASARQQQQDPYASLQTLQQGPYASLQQLKRQKRPVSLISGESGYFSTEQQQKPRQQKIKYSGTNQQQQQQQRKKKQKMQQASGLYAKPMKQPRYAGITFVGQQGPRQSSTDVYQTVPSQTLNAQLVKQVNRGKQQQPTYVPYNPKQNRALPPTPRQQLLKQLSSMQLPQQSQQLYQPIVDSPRLSMYKNILENYKKARNYPELINTIIVKTKAIDLDAATKAAVINMVEQNMGRLIERLDNAISKLEYKQQAGNDKVLYINSNERLVQFIRELESREFKIMTELLDYATKDHRALTQQQKRKNKQQAFKRAKQAMKKSIK